MSHWVKPVSSTISKQWPAVDNDLSNHQLSRINTKFGLIEKAVQIRQLVQRIVFLDDWLKAVHTNATFGSMKCLPGWLEWSRRDFRDRGPSSATSERHIDRRQSVLDVSSVCSFNDVLMICRFNDIWFVCPNIFRPPTSIPEYSDSVSDIGPVGQASLFRSNHPDRFSGSGLISGTILRRRHRSLIWTVKMKHWKLEITQIIWLVYHKLKLSLPNLTLSNVV